MNRIKPILAGFLKILPLDGKLKHIVEHVEFRCPLNGCGRDEIERYFRSASTLKTERLRLANKLKQIKALFTAEELKKVFVGLSIIPYDDFYICKPRLMRRTDVVNGNLTIRVVTAAGFEDFDLPMPRPRPSHSPLP